MIKHWGFSFHAGPEILDEKERAAIQKAQEVINGIKSIPCTACHYCTAGCPKQIHIPEIFAARNSRSSGDNWKKEKPLTHRRFRRAAKHPTVFLRAVCTCLSAAADAPGPPVSAITLPDVNTGDVPEEMFEFLSMLQEE